MVSLECGQAAKGIGVRNVLIIIINVRGVARIFP